MNRAVKLLTVVAPLLVGCADYNASKYEAITQYPPTADRRVAFDTCNHQAWMGEPHPALAFGAVGGLADALATGPSTRSIMINCMASHGWARP